MNSNSIEVVLALVPFAMLVGGFLVFRLSGLQTSFCAWVVELAIAIGYYHMPVLRAVESSLWGNLTMWTGFLVLYTGQIFGQSYRSAGLLQILLDSVESILPARDKEGRAIALVTVVGGFIGAFNGFATYPVTIPGLVQLGFDKVRASAGYLVYLAWSIPFVSLFIAANISSAATHLPIPQIAQVSGILTIPAVFISIMGFFKILGFRFFERETQILFWLLSAANIAGVLLFTQLFPQYYILTLIAGAGFSLLGLYIYGRMAMPETVTPIGGVPAAAQTEPGTESAVSLPPHTTTFKAYAPLLIGVVLVVLTSIGSVSKSLTHLAFSVDAWGYQPLTINIFTSAGFFILVTALCCYLFRTKEASAVSDIVVATKRSLSSLAALFCGSAMVYIMVDSGQIALLGKALAGTGKLAYSALFPFLAFLGGMAFGQGLPGDFLFSQMQTSVAPLLGIPLIVLVGVVTVITMGPSNPLKPAQITYVASLANVKGEDGTIFRIALPWQIAQVVIAAILTVLLVVL